MNSKEKRSFRDISRDTASIVSLIGLVVMVIAGSLQQYIMYVIGFLVFILALVSFTILLIIQLIKEKKAGNNKDKKEKKSFRDMLTDKFFRISLIGIVLMTIAELSRQAVIFYIGFLLCIVACIGVIIEKKSDR